MFQSDFPMKREPPVTIVLVNYNGWWDTIECLESIFKLEYSNFQVVVIDNGSSNQSLQRLCGWAEGAINRWLSFKNSLRSHVLPPVAKPIPYSTFSFSDGSFVPKSVEMASSLTIINLGDGINRGFAFGMNVGIQFALENTTGEYFWLLNNDMVASKDSLKALASLALQEGKDKKIGIIGSKLFYYHAPESLQGVAGRYRAWLGQSLHVGASQIDMGQFDQKSFSFDYVIGAAMFVDRKFVEDVGKLSEDYFLYFEELDWAQRGKKKGWKLGFCANSKIFHKEGASTNSQRRPQVKSDLADYYQIKNRFLFTKRFYPSFLPLIYCTLIPVFFRRLLRRNFKMAYQVLRFLIFRFERV